MEELLARIPLYSEILSPLLLPAGGSKGGLYLGRLEVAENPDLLKSLSIGAILTIIGYPLRLDFSCAHMQISAFDRDSQDISTHFSASSTFISQHLKSTNVYVHCQMGISRSSTLVLAYLLTKNAPTTLEKELAFLRSKRNCVDPNDGFLKQLQIFQSSIISTSNTTYSSKKGKEIPSKPFTTDKN